MSDQNPSTTTSGKALFTCKQHPGQTYTAIQAAKLAGVSDAAIYLAAKNGRPVGTDGLVFTRVPGSGRAARGSRWGKARAVQAAVLADAEAEAGEGDVSADEARADDRLVLRVAESVAASSGGLASDADKLAAIGYVRHIRRQYMQLQAFLAGCGDIEVRDGRVRFRMPAQETGLGKSSGGSN
jgi:hypothetical protein